MKKFSLLLIFTLVTSLSVFAQGSNTFPSWGHVGIGTQSPIHALHLKYPEGTRARFEFGYSVVDIVGYGNSWQDYANSQGIFMYGADGLIMTEQNLNLRIITNDGSFKERVRILANGNMGIGTKTPQYLLSVNGTIGTKEVHVTATGWADYVFSPNYKLMPLNEVENFIKEHGHLPNIPSAEQVKEEGINLSEINVKLLEKIEELTLHLIRQQQEIDSLKKEIEVVRVQD
ncbi:hypothetical protein JYB64_21005 [Algoriphagus aestuarii]|nr:hypothetical protein [Algoriphagus aestuarii]